MKSREFHWNRPFSAVRVRLGYIRYAGNCEQHKYMYFTAKRMQINFMYSLLTAFTDDEGRRFVFSANSEEELAPSYWFSDSPNFIFYRK